MIYGAMDVFGRSDSRLAPPFRVVSHLTRQWYEPLSAAPGVLVCQSVLFPGRL